MTYNWTSQKYSHKTFRLMIILLLTKNSSKWFKLSNKHNCSKWQVYPTKAFNMIICFFRHNFILKTNIASTLYEIPYA